MERVGRSLLVGFERHLGLADGFFAPFFEKPLVLMRLLHYPPLPQEFLVGGCWFVGCVLVWYPNSPGLTPSPPPSSHCHHTTLNTSRTQPQTSGAADIVTCGEHSDYGALTLLSVDSPGLQVRSRTGEWISAPVVADALILNLGDMMQVRRV